MASTISFFHLRRTLLCALVASLFALSIAGCVRLLEPRQSEITYYLLDSATETAVAEDTTGVEVGLLRPKMASYLDATRIVTRRGPNEVQFSEYQRWGEQLGRAINRVVAQNLKAQPSVQAAQAVPWSDGATFDYVLQLEVLHFEGQGPAPPGPDADDDAPVPEGRSNMAVRWTIYGPDGETVRARGLTRQRREGWPVDDYGALVTRLNASLEVLANDVADRLVRLEQQ